jgi:hypothetical protein
MSSIQDKNDYTLSRLASKVSDEMHRLLTNSIKEPTISIKDAVLKMLEEEINKYKLSTIGVIIEKYQTDMLFMSPPKEDAEKFLDSCLCDSRLDKIRRSLENYINGKTDIITDL